MKTSRMLPIGFLSLVLAGTGTMVANAQTAPVPPAPPQAQDQTRPQPSVPSRGDGSDSRDGQRGKHDGHGKRHGRGPGDRGDVHGRGSSELFQQMFTQIDTDQDGRITQAEIDTFRAAKVGTADASGDGALSLDEFDTLYRELTRTRMVRAFQSLDADGDGVITAAEMDTRFGSLVDRMDRDGDGALSVQDRGARR